MKRFERKAFSLIRWLNVPVSVYICYVMEYVITYRGSIFMSHCHIFGCLKSDSRFDYINSLL